MGDPGVTPSATQLPVHPHCMMPLHTHAHGPCDFFPTLSMSHAQTAPRAGTLTSCPLSPSPAVPSASGNCLGAAPAWPLAGISPAVAASLGPLEQLQEEELVGMAQALSGPHPSVCNLVLPVLPCLPWAAGPQQTPLPPWRAPRRGRGGDWHRGGEGQAQKGRWDLPSCTAGLGLLLHAVGEELPSRLQTYTLRCLQLFMGTWKSCLPCFQQPSSFMQRAACSPSWLDPRRPWVTSIQEGSLGRARTPQAVPDSAGQWREGPVQHLSLLLRGCKGLGGPTPGHRYHLWGQGSSGRGQATEQKMDRACPGRLG